MTIQNVVRYYDCKTCGIKFDVGSKVNFCSKACMNKGLFSVDPTKRFFENTKIQVGGCWNWIGGVNDGYGRLKVGGKMIRAHRYSYTIHVGPIPDGLMVLHKCHNKLCVNPSHLKIGTNLENMRDEIERGTHASQIKYNRIPIIFDGVEYQSIKEASEKLGINYTTLYSRVKKETYERKEHESND